MTGDVFALARLLNYIGTANASDESLRMSPWTGEREPSILMQSEEAVTFRKSTQNDDGLILPMKISSSRPMTRSLSTTSLRKIGDWLAYKPYVQLMVDQESQEISAKTQHVLDAENQYKQCLDGYLREVESADLRRKEMQHKKWTECVAEPLQKSIESYIDGQSSQDIERRRRLLLDQYLKYCNKRGSAYMRDYDSSEYDPFINRLWKQYLRVSTPPFKDPLLQQYQKRYEEEKVALYCDTGMLYSAKEIGELNLNKLPRAPLGRQTVNGIEWLKTPFSYVESEIRLKSRQRVRSSMNQGTLDFKTWADTKYPPEIFSTERNICHKKKFLTRASTLPAYSNDWGPEQSDNMIPL
ncbi:protein FAM228B-like [Gastrophryne carolinensis]